MIIEKKITGVILAGGRGKRLMSMTDKIPKPLITVGGRKLISYAIDFLNNIGVTSYLIVGGYKSDLLKVEVEKEIPSMTFIVSDYRNATLDGFSYALPYIKNQKDSSGVFVCNADYVFTKKTMQEVAKKIIGFSIFCSHNITGNLSDVMKVQESERGELVDMSKSLTSFQSIFIGAFFCSAEYINPMCEVVQNLLKTVDKQIIPVERLFTEMSKIGVPVTIQDVGHDDWFEIDTVEEWKAAKIALE